jgi:hypothetical protein
MRILKSLILSLVLLPFFSAFAAATPSVTISNVSMGCYGAFRTVWSMLPDIADKLNDEAGMVLFEISGVKAPLSNPSTFQMTIDTSPQGLAEGKYKLYQKYTPGATATSNGTLDLRWDQLPDTLPTEHLDKFWVLVKKGFGACTL